MEEFLNALLDDCGDANLQLADPKLVQYYHDYQNRIIWMLGEVGEVTFDWVAVILDYNRQDKGIPIDERKPIKFLIANYGGSMEEAKTLTEIISLSKTPVYGVSIGMCASAASMIYLSCHKRYATANSTFLLHKGSCNNVSGNYNEVQQFMESYKKDIEDLTEFYKKNTTFDEKTVEEKLEKGDWYIYIDEAITNGIVHEVVKDIDVLL